MLNAPKISPFYIDYEAMARHIELAGKIFTIEFDYKEVHIFWNHKI